MALPAVNDIELSNGSKVDKARIEGLVTVVDKSESGTINYLEFLQAFSFEDTKGGEMMDCLAEHILAVLFRHRQAFRQGALFFDEFGTGIILKEEFVQIMEGLNLALSMPEAQFLDSQIQLLAEALSVEKNGLVEIPYEDFLCSFEVV